MGNVACEHRAALVRAASELLGVALQRAHASGRRAKLAEVLVQHGRDEHARVVDEDAAALLDEAGECATRVVESLQMALASVHCQDCARGVDPSQLSMWEELS